MRQPKFRGYSRGTKQWHYGFGWFNVDYTEEFLAETGYPQQARLMTYTSPLNCDLESMGEFTGLKDKNGKEIYEGDIVEYNDFDSLRTGGHAGDKIIVGKVAFSCGMWMVEENNCGHDLYEGLVNDEELKIIDNIYENPELLEVQP